MSQIYIKNTKTATILGKDKWPNMKLENDLDSHKVDMWMAKRHKELYWISLY